MELMIHRRLLDDDAFGVGEPLNETAFGKGLVVRGKHWFQYESGGFAQAAKRHRFKAQETFMDAHLTFMPTEKSFQDWKAQYLMEYSSLNQALPSNVHLLTVEEWSGKSRTSVLIRLEHFFEAQDDPDGMSKPVTLSLENMFQAFKVENVEEVILGANLQKDKLKRLDWNVENEIPNETIDQQNKVDAAPWTVELNAFQIRTFIVDLLPKA